MKQNKGKVLSKIVLSTALPLAVLAGTMGMAGVASAAVDINNVSVFAIKTDSVVVKN